MKVRAAETRKGVEVSEIGAEKGCEECRFRAKVWGLEYCVQGRSQPGANNMRRCNFYKGGDTK